MASVNDSGRWQQRDAADQNFDYMFKLLIIGNSSVGKTSFLFRYADDRFTSAFVSTVGIDFKVNKTVQIRAIQVDYNPLRIGGQTDHNLRIGAGIVF